MLLSFFFFKQKTAYEMRISGWSSDVCSSDLLLAAIAEYDGLALRSATKVTAAVLAAASRLKVVGRAGIGVDNIDVPAATARGEIGRAACRERVCQSV